MEWIGGVKTQHGRARFIFSPKVFITHPFSTRAHICHEYHKLYLWRKKCHVEKFWENLRNFGKFWEILRNFGRFCHNLHAFMWRKIEPKKYICGEKMTNMRSAQYLGADYAWGVMCA